VRSESCPLSGCWSGVFAVPPAPCANLTRSESITIPLVHQLLTADTAPRMFGHHHRSQALKAIPKNGPYFFWTGNGKVKSTVGNWQRALKLLFDLAEVPTAHAHRFRDTFAVEALLAGIPLERVSILLGHQSVRITERHYSPWVRERQEQIEDDVRRMWKSEKGGHVLGTRLKVVK
jgi:integrase